MALRVCVTLVICLSVLINAGCNPRIRVRKSPGINDSGIRYYRPKPYLLVSPSGSSVTVKESKKETTTTSVSDEYVSIELQYLPDFSEEYALDVRSGLGTADVSLTLKDGWMLTEVNQKLDSQFDENVKATAELLKAGASIIPTGVEVDGGGGPVEVTKKWVVQATNVPLGYYESVITKGPCGKHLSGWRYVGFAPFNSCPTTFCGNEVASCSDPITGPVYGLTFTDGVMMFRRLDDLQGLSEKTPRRGLVTYGGSTHQVQAEDVTPVEQTALTIEALQQELLEKANTHLGQAGVDGRFVLELDMPQDADAWDVRVKAQWEAVAEPAVAEAVIEDLEKIFFGVFKQRKLLANIKIKHVVPAALPPSSRGASYAIPPVRY